ncbi:TlpA disulfide reductase family protein [Idiomarina loihiensis]|jgi:thiol-disulfide isomerase/thioredoxin|uniref:Thioredoxin related protein n=2 Tax=Idiomarina TaxID=135575 RepID=Q5R155_IDILO|nr:MULTISPECIES: TlpA disulfide reductase family protein [Idiomarina]NWO02942.1 TlpA family protein disulfide reductase [Idiomarinaceae bacterium]AAV82304.1 Thioredoxin related protein [Idiomarina loihiensis L2TR]MBL4857183.1 TlpA family protein disulfide reductase [Idiomarina sp.]MCP1340208.1 TlpA family protein disulfide reductase [Idiomarina rhizosphaerae]PHQ88599.1 MAG: TlpA family protein disulfide reductase [Idiomarina sp.]|tara:strand:- start:1305 stop:1754 length:450 start_codon:yes stop_codon:yes gene_type:complete
MKLRTLVCAAAAVLITACSQEPDVVTDADNEFRWGDLGEKTVVVNYFAEWCAPCLRELPELNEFNQHKAKDVELVGVSFDPMSNAELAELKQRHGIEFQLALMEPAPKFPFQRPQMLPATYVIKPDGSVKGPLMGEQDLESLENAVNSH